MTNKSYHIETFEQLLNIANEENAERLMKDFNSWVMYYITVIEQFKKELPEATKGKSNWDICDSTFVWVDDGKNDFLGCNLVDRQTGEVINIKPDDK